MILMAVLSEAWKYLIFACCPSSSLFCVHGLRVASSDEELHGNTQEM